MENIRVVVRVRPFLPNELPQRCITVCGSQIAIGDERRFAFDDVFDMNTNSETVNDAVAAPLVSAFVSGYTVSTIAYGQTGAGKTHTMSRLSADVVQRVSAVLKEANNNNSDDENKNVDPIFTFSAVEVYNEHLTDLLAPLLNSSTNNSNNNNTIIKTNNGTNTIPPNASSSTTNTIPFAGNSWSSSTVVAPSNVIPSASTTTTNIIINNNNYSSPLQGPATLPSLPIREDARSGVYIQGLSEIIVQSEDELISWIEKTTSNRRTASTMMNATSSRSHCLLTITLSRNGTVSRFGLVDLAGSERMKKAYGRRLTTTCIEEVDDDKHLGPYSSRSKHNLEAEIGVRVREGISINSGLLALGNVIVALCEHKSHVPYRTSKLTRLLQPMLSGNSKTTMIACISPDASSFEETLNTLKYADRAKSIRTTPFRVAATFNTLEDAEKTILWLRQRLEKVEQKLQEQQSLESYTFPVSKGQRVEELEELLECERNLTQRLQEDLFNAEYVAMVEVEKRKQLEKRIMELELITQERNIKKIEELDIVKPVDESYIMEEIMSVEQDELLKKLQQLEAERDELQALKERKEIIPLQLAQFDANASVIEETTKEIYPVCTRRGIDDSIQEQISREIAGKENLIHLLTQENEEAARALENAKINQEEMNNVKQHLEEELARAEAKLELTEMERQSKEDERRKLQTQYQVRLRKAEEEAAEYRRKVQEASNLVASREANSELIKQLQSQILDMNDELNKQRYAVREGQQRAQKMAASHAQEVNQLQKQMRETESQVARLQVQLQKKEREIARARNNSTNISKRQQFGSRQQPTTTTTTTTTKATPVISSVANNTIINTGPTSFRTTSLSKNQQSESKSDEVQREIDIELMALAVLERELDELTADRDELKKTVNDAQQRTGGMPKWKKAIKGFTMRLQRLEEELESHELNEEIHTKYINEKSNIEEKLRQLQCLEPIFEQASKQLVELDSSIDSLQEARKYHLRRVRRLQKGALTPSEGNARASELLFRPANGNNNSKN